MEIIRLKNGTRVALEPKKDALSVAINIFIGTGSSSENDSEQGYAHFIEHMLFKGSEKYSSKEISTVADMFGGQMNAYTTKEYTCYLTRVLPEHFAEMLSVICDMVTRPKFAKEALESEKGVIIEEIGMYEDSPEDLGFDLLTSSVFEGSRLAHPILGTRETVSAVTPESLKAFFDKHYTPERTVISICGKYDKESVLKELEGTFGEKQSGAEMVGAEGEFSNKWVLHKKDTEQSHVFLAFNGVPLDNDLRYAIALYTEIVGGGTSSRLFTKIREELGLVYGTYAYNTSYLSCGNFGLWAGLSHKNQGRFIEESMKILRDMKEFNNADELFKVKQQFKANTVMGSESTSGTASSIGRQILLKNEYIDASETARLIDAVTEEDIRKVAGLFYTPESIAICVVGKPEKQEYYQKIIDQFK